MPKEQAHKCKSGKGQQIFCCRFLFQRQAVWTSSLRRSQVCTTWRKERISYFKRGHSQRQFGGTGAELAGPERHCVCVCVYILPPRLISRGPGSGQERFAARRNSTQVYPDHSAEELCDCVSLPFLWGGSVFRSSSRNTLPLTSTRVRLKFSVKNVKRLSCHCADHLLPPSGSTCYMRCLSSQWTPAPLASVAP